MLLLSRVWLEKCSMWMVRCRDLDTIASNSQTLLASHYGADPFLNAWGDRFFLSRLVAELPESQISSLQSCFLGQPTILLHTRLRSAGWDSLVSSTSRLLTGSLEDQFIRVLLYYFMDRLLRFTIVGIAYDSERPSAGSLITSIPENNVILLCDIIIPYDSSST